MTQGQQFPATNGVAALLKPNLSSRNTHADKLARPPKPNCEAALTSCLSGQRQRAAALEGAEQLELGGASRWRFDDVTNETLS